METQDIIIGIAIVLSILGLFVGFARSRKSSSTPLGPRPVPPGPGTPSRSHDDTVI